LALVRQTFAGQYTVDREIGQGGAARIFLARDRSGRKVALKILRPEYLSSVATDRFLREIQFTARLKHPHIAELLDSGESDWLVYYVMPFIEGPSLREVINSRRQLTVADTLRIGCELLDALAHAHECGIIHRDVKPENVILSPELGVVLLDLGIARAIVSSIAERITRTDITVGSSAYMSPEQINASQEIDPRSDLYAVGCILFECLVGRPPFVRRQEMVVLQLHLTEPAPDVRALRPDVPPNLAAAIATALAKRPEERCQSAHEMQNILGSCAAV
jgi:serine/threonine-protein kinase